MLDVENLRLHYARTLTDWLALFETNVDRVRGMFDEKFVRMWRLYLAGSVAAFTTGTLQLFQVLFATAENNNVALTRDHLYQPLGLEPARDPQRCTDHWRGAGGLLGGAPAANRAARMCSSWTRKPSRA